MGMKTLYLVMFDALVTRRAWQSVKSLPGSAMFVMLVKLLESSVQSMVKYLPIPLKIRVRVKVMFRFKDRAKVGIVFRISMWFPLSIQWRGVGGNLSVVLKIN